MTILIILKHICYICERTLSDVKKLQHHLLSLHEVSIPSRPRGRRRFDNASFCYNVNNGNHSEAKVHVACPSCFSHFDKLNELKDHVESSHLDGTLGNTSMQNVNDRPKKKLRNYEENCNGEATSSTTDSDNADENENECIGTDTNKFNHDSKIVQIANTGKATILSFTSCDINVYSPNQPKLTKVQIKKLSPLLKIITPYNRELEESTKLLIEKEQQDQNNLKILKSYPAAYLLLVDAMEIPIHDLPKWLWNHVYSQSSTVRDIELMLAIKYTLTDFAGKCNRKRLRQTNSERTFWINRIVPIFQPFADQTGLLDFEWCEVFSKAHAETTVDTESWLTGYSRYVDGLGHDLYECERLVMEASSGEFKENIPHTIDDTAKQINSSIMMLKSNVRKHLDASFETMCKVEVYGIQTVRNSITLSKTSLNDIQGGYIYQELRTTEIPVNYIQRHKWLKVMDLMAVLLSLLEKQEKIMKQLDLEQNGAADVQDNLRVRSVLNIL